MAIKKYNVDVYATITDTETDAKREEVYTRPIATMYQKGTEIFIDLMETAASELAEQIADDLLDIEELTSWTLYVREA